jgi:hypothetical protein
MLRKRKYGEAIIVVSGLPRSGTSMMMKMLEAAGLPIMTDSIRTADDDNPKGYFEYERVKDLDKESDKSWLHEARGKVIKIISFLLPHLPEENFYKIIFVRRHLDEVIASQNKMLVHRNETDADATDDKMKQNYRQHLRKIEIFVFRNPNVDVLEIDHREAIEHPLESATKVCRFLGLKKTDPQSMAAVVDPELYRNRA